MAKTNTAYIPGEYNTGVVRGDTFSETATFITGGEPLNLAGAAIRIQLRTRSGEVVASLEGGSGIQTVGNVMTWTIEGATTAGFAVGQYLYDIEITLGGSTRTYAAGSFAIQKDITA